MRPAAPSASPVADTLCRIVAVRPGIHFRGLCRAAQLRSLGQLRHHLDRLRARGVVVEVREGQFKRYFLPGQYDARWMPTLARFSRRMPFLIGSLLLERPMRRSELRRRLACADSTLGHHLKRLVASGDLRRDDRQGLTYALAEPELLLRLLQSPEARPTPLHERRRVRRPGHGRITEGPAPLAPTPSMPHGEPAADGSAPAEIRDV